MIQRLLDWTDQTDKPNLTQIEDEVLALRKEMSLCQYSRLMVLSDIAPWMAHGCRETVVHLRGSSAN